MPNMAAQVQRCAPWCFSAYKNLRCRRIKPLWSREFCLLLLRVSLRNSPWKFRNRGRSESHAHFVTMYSNTHLAATRDSRTVKSHGNVSFMLYKTCNIENVKAISEVCLFVLTPFTVKARGSRQFADQRHAVVGKLPTTGTR